MMNKKSGRGSIVLRLLKTIREFYPVMMPVTVVCIVFSAVVSSVPAIFMQNVIAVVEQSWRTGDWASVGGQILHLVSILAVFYVLSLTSSLAFNQLMAIMTQGTLKKLRVKMFNGMQRLPIKYFDTNNHGDIMSYYTNDIDTLRQMVSQSFPQILTSSIMVLTVFCIMLYYSIWLAIVIVFGMIIMLLAVRKIGGGSARYFFRQQVAVGKVEGFVEEIMNGEKVVKVFCHERETEADFDKLNEELFYVAKQANRYANILGPVLNNMGNALYVLVAVAGGLLLLFRAPNLSISGLGISISIVVPFLNMTKQFSGNIFQVSNQINSVVMGLAGAERIFTLMDQQPEADDGYVTLVNVQEEDDGTLTECKERTGIWAWKHPHQADGTITYTKLQGDGRLFDVDFEYEPDKPVLHDISLYAKPGQKVAFVGATGAGKTTMTRCRCGLVKEVNGTVRLDGQALNAKQRNNASFCVMQDVNHQLFSDSVWNECELAQPDCPPERIEEILRSFDLLDFKDRHPMALSGGQKQRLAVATAILSDKDVLVFDEPTSGLDYHRMLEVSNMIRKLNDENKVIIIVSHDFEFLGRTCDKIFDMEGCSKERR